MKNHVHVLKYIMFAALFSGTVLLTVWLVKSGTLSFVSEKTPEREEFDYETEEEILEDLLNEGDVSAVQQNEFDLFLESLPDLNGEPAAEYVAGETVVSIDRSFEGFSEASNFDMPAPDKLYDIPSGYTCTGAQDGILLLNRGGKYGYFLETGYWLTDPEFTEAYGFCGGVAVVGVDGRYGVIDKTGSFIIPAVFDSIGDMDGSGMTAYKRGTGYVRIAFSKK